MKILVSDIDGTIVVNHNISDELRKKFNEFKASPNNLVILATGRNTKTFKNAQQKYQLDFFDFIVLSNGAVIKNSENQLIHYEIIDTETLRVIGKKLEKIDYSITIYLSSLENQSVFTSVKEFNQYLNFIHFKNPMEVTSVCIETENQDVTAEIQETLKIDTLSITFNGKYVDITNKMVSKRYAVEKLLANLEINSETRILSIGDGNNDLDIIKMTEESYTFDYADEVIKSEANYIVKNMEEFFYKIED